LTTSRSNQKFERPKSSLLIKKTKTKGLAPAMTARSPHLPQPRLARNLSSFRGSQPNLRESIGGIRPKSNRSERPKTFHGRT